jgi:glycosyltransferase involved in cell wall biosynthesis
MTLLNAMDCYISLHRGEGLGLGIVEALALNIPVIATNYGGNSEYMNNPLAMAVPYSMIPANDDYPPYKHVKSWADPDIGAAKKFMRTVYKEKIII